MIGCGLLALFIFWLAGKISPLICGVGLAVVAAAVLSMRDGCDMRPRPESTQTPVQRAEPTATLYAWPGEGDAFGWLTKDELEQAQAARSGGKLPPNAMRASSGTTVRIVERDGRSLKVVLGGGSFVGQTAWVDARDVR